MKREDVRRSETFGKKNHLALTLVALGVLSSCDKPQPKPKLTEAQSIEIAAENCAQNVDEDTGRPHGLYFSCEGKVLGEAEKIFDKKHPGKRGYKLYGTEDGSFYENWKPDQD